MSKKRSKRQSETPVEETLDGSTIEVPDSEPTEYPDPGRAVVPSLHMPEICATCRYMARKSELSGDRVLCVRYPNSLRTQLDHSCGEWKGIDTEAKKPDINLDDDVLVMGGNGNLQPGIVRDIAWAVGVWHIQVQLRNDSTCIDWYLRDKVLVPGDKVNLK